MGQLQIALTKTTCGGVNEKLTPRRRHKNWLTDYPQVEQKGA